ncbi:uncharacterized protein LOC142333518 isoform X2 [Lycorma delicatula]|uniref:uncharacterized protein LOC142333518 isoform X2 n=1 Tax=Lycorma delicatula TaxID=130591 RepID=UPI003F50EBA4
MKNITVINMLIIIYVMSFFILCAENVYREKDLFDYTKFLHTEKYADLQTSCQNSYTFYKSYASYIKEIYEKMEQNTRWFGNSNFEKLKKQIQLKIFEDETRESKTVLPTLLKLLDVIPDKILIKKGIINTEKKSLISGIDITKTIPHDVPNEIITGYPISTYLPCHSWDEKKDYRAVKFVTLDGNYVEAYIDCGRWLAFRSFSVSDEEREEVIIDKIPIPCTLRLNTGDDFRKNIFPILNQNLASKINTVLYSKQQFEIYFSYVCKFISPLQVFKNKEMMQYKVLNFTVTGYHLNSCIFPNAYNGLTYCLQHQINYLKGFESEKDFFLYEFTTEN